jgi:hypothetical protein
VFVTVEPQDGTELERLITVLLNITGVVHRLVDEAVSDAAEPHEVMSVVAERLHDALAVIPEHHSDEELAVLTGILAYATVLGASELGLGDVFRPPDAV